MEWDPRWYEAAHGAAFLFVSRLLAAHLRAVGSGSKFVATLPLPARQGLP